MKSDEEIQAQEVDLSSRLSTSEICADTTPPALAEPL